MTFLYLLITLTCGTVGGLIAKKLRLPGGLLVGAIFGTAIFHVITANAYIPKDARTLAQIVAGAFSACAITRTEVKKMPRVIAPALLVLFSLFAVNIISGVLILAVSKLDLVTSLFAMIPGSLQNTPLVAADYNADVPSVAVLQLVRLIMGLGVLPFFITKFSKRYKGAPVTRQGVAHTPGEKASNKPIDAVLTAGIALASGYLGVLLKFPGGALIFSTWGVMIFQIITGRAWLPKIFKKAAQIICGCYIGAMIGIDELIRLGDLILPAIIAAVAYSVACVLLGIMLNRFFGYSVGEGMLMGTPAGAADMLLIASDMGVDSSDLVLVHLIRMISAVVLFPPLMGWIASIF